MSRKKSKKKNSEILRLKILLEDKETAEEELDIGSRELTQILQEYSKNIAPDQKKKYDNFFFGTTSRHSKKGSSANDAAEIIISKSIDNQTNEKKASNKNHIEPWVKKLYKQIVQRSHPDKYIDFPIIEIKEKFTRIYMNTIDALEANDIGLLLLCAYEVEIKVEEPSAKKYIKSSSDLYTTKIKSISQLIGYQWYHLPDINRIYFLENYLKSLGFFFNKSKANSAIKNNKIKRRKAGTRPPKIIRSTS